MKEQSKRLDGIEKPSIENSSFNLIVRFRDTTKRLRRMAAAVFFAQMTLVTAFTVQSYAAKNVPLKAHKGDGRAGALLSVSRRITPSTASEGVAANLAPAGTRSLMATGYRKQVATDSIPWLQTNGPYGGVVRALTTNSSGYVFAGTDLGGGVYLSTDNGASWTEVNNGLPNDPVYSLAVNSSGYIFAGMYGDGVYLSTNNGASWTQVNNGLTNSNVYSLAINSSGYIFAGTYGGGVYISTNNGANWAQVNNGLTNLNIWSLAINSYGYIFAGTLSAGVFLSTDNGNSWTTASTGLPNSEVLSLAINSYGYVYAGTYGGGVYLSMDDGTSWAAVNNGLTNGAVQALAINSSDYIFAGTNGGAVYYSGDYGSDWTQVNTGLTNDDVWSLATNIYGYVFAGTWGEGVYVSANSGSSWTQTNTGLAGSEIWSLAVNSSDNVFAGAIGGGVFESTDSGNSWALSGLIENAVQSIAFNSTGYIFAGTNGEGVYLSADHGTSWTQVDNGLTDSSVQALAINSSGYIFAGTYGGSVYLSTDNASSWTQVNNGLGDSSVQSLVVNSSGDIFAGTWGGGVYLSTNNGTSWTQSGLGNSEVFSLAINSSGYIYAGTWGGGVFVSTNNGSSWNAVNNGLANSYVQSLAINSLGYIFAGTWLGGVYESTNDGASWTQIGLSSDDIQSLALNSTGYLFAGSEGEGVYRTSNSTVGTLPPTPILASPAYDTTGVSTNPTLTWNASTVATSSSLSATKRVVVKKDGRLLKVSQTAELSYRIQLSTDSTFAASSYVDTTVADTFLVVSGLSSQTKYYWRVNATDSAGTSAWSTTWSFTTGGQLSITWSQVNNGLSNSYVQSLTINSSGYIFAGTYASGVFRSTDNGASWAQVGLTGTEVYSFAINSVGYVFAGVGYFNSGVYFSTDNGSSWTPVGLTSNNAVAALAINSSDYIFAGTYGGIYLSTDNGTDWTPVNNGLPSSPNILSLAINSSGYIFAGMGYVSANQGVYLSSDNGTSWASVGLTNTGNVHALTINSSGYVFAGTDSGVYLSPNDGKSWKQVGLPGAQVMSFAINSSGYIFAGTLVGGAYFSTNNGTSWAQINNGLTNINVQSLAISSSGYIFAGTWGGGIYRASISSAAPPPAPTLASPANGATGVSTSPTLTWNASPIAASYSLSAAKRAIVKKGGRLLKVSQTAGLSYRIQLSLDSTFASSAYIDTTVADTFLAVIGLSAQTKYYWRVNATDSAGTSQWSTIWNFTTAIQLSWTHVNIGLTNTAVMSLAINSSGYVFAGTYGGGVYLSTNNGTSWTQNGLTSSIVYSLAINSSGYIFAGTGGGIYLSTNNGTSWTQVNNGLTNSNVYSLAINSSGYIFAGTYGGGVYLSTNNGTSWTAVNNGLTNTEVRALAINSSGYIFAGTYGGGVYLSTNTGTSWTQANNGLTNTDGYSLAINSFGYIFAGTGQNGVYLSTNSGTSWTQVNNGLTSSSVLSLAINSSGYIFAGTGVGVYLSTNNGASWTQMNNGLTHTNVYSLAINSSASYIFAGTDGGGVYRASISSAAPPPAPALASPVNGATGVSTSPTLTWNASTIAASYSSSAAKRAVVKKGERLSKLSQTAGLSYRVQLSTDSTFAANSYVDTTVADTFLVVNGLSSQTKYYWRVNATDSAGTSGWSAVWNFTTANQLSWTQMNNGLTNSTVRSLAINSSGYVFAGTDGGGVYLSANSGTSWAQVNNGLTNSAAYSLAIKSSVYFFAGTLAGVYLSTNNGASWTQDGLTGTYVFSLAINASGFIFAGTQGNGAYLSTNNGSSWTQINNGLTNSYVYSLAINSSGYIFAGTSGGGVYISANNGTSWTQINSVSMDSTVWSLAINSSGYIFAGTKGQGIYLSTDNGASWTQDGLTNSIVRSLAINSSGYIFAGTSGGGVYISANNGTSWTQVNNGLTNSYVYSLAINNSSGYIFAGTNGGGVYRANILSGVPPPAPTLASPANDSTGVSISPTLTWKTPAGVTSSLLSAEKRAVLKKGGRLLKVSQTGLSYRIQLSTDSTFATVAYIDTTVADTFLAVSGLSSQTKYYWRVNATDSAGTSAWSTIWSFTSAIQLSWAQINNGLTNSYVQSLAVNSSGYIFAGTQGGVYLSTNNGTSWTQSSLTSRDVYSLAVNSSGYIFAGTAGGVYLSTNNGTSLTQKGLTSSNVYSLAINSSGYIFAGTYGGMYLSTNNGTSWTQVGLTSSEVYSVAINSSGYIFAGTWSGGVYLSTNNGTNWSQVNTGLTSSGVMSLAINSSGYIFAGTLAGVYLSTNNGTSWMQVGLTSSEVYSFAINSSGYIFAGTYSGGVYLSMNNGASWTQNGLTSSYVYSLAISSSGYIFAGTNGGGIYRASVPSVAPPPAPTLATPATGTTGLAANLTLTWNASKGATSYELQVSKDSTFATTVFDKAKLTVTSQEVTGLSQGTTYYWRVNATSSNGSSSWSSVWSFVTFTYPQSISLSMQYAPPAAIDSTNYRIIGLPGDIDIPLSDVLAGNHGTDWDAYWDNGDDQNYYVEYPSDGRFYFMPGTAFWILSKNPFSVSRNAATVPLDTSNCFSIILHSGWNLISNPFEKSVIWSSVQTLNSVVQPIYFFKGSYDTTASFDPYVGYYFYNGQVLTSLEIPYVYSTPSQSKVEGFARKTSSAQSNTIKLSLSSRNRKPLPITVGFNPTVSDTLNRLNIFAPPDNFTDMSIQIVDQNVKGYWKKLFSDVRSEVGKGQSFDIEVKNLTTETAAMKSALTGGLENCDVYLVDNGTHTFYNLKTTDSISIGRAYKYKSFALLIGNGNYIDSIKAIYAPKSYELYQNYPNPFNPVTIIRYEIPKDASVTLKVYNVLGQLVRTLVDQVQQSGYYEAVFDGTGLASGVYFCRLNAGNYSQVKKMALIK